MGILAAGPPLLGGYGTQNIGVDAGDGSKTPVIMMWWPPCGGE